MVGDMGEVRAAPVITLSPTDGSADQYAGWWQPACMHVDQALSTDRSWFFSLSYFTFTSEKYYRRLCCSSTKHWDLSPAHCLVPVLSLLLWKNCHWVTACPTGSAKIEIFSLSLSIYLLFKQRSYSQRLWVASRSERWRREVSWWVFRSLDTPENFNFQFQFTQISFFNLFILFTY